MKNSILRWSTGIDPGIQVRLRVTKKINWRIMRSPGCDPASDPLCTRSASPFANGNARECANSVDDPRQGSRVFVFAHVVKARDGDNNSFPTICNIALVRHSDYIRANVLILGRQSNDVASRERMQNRSQGRFFANNAAGSASSWRGIHRARGANFFGPSLGSYETLWCVFKCLRWTRRKNDLVSGKLALKEIINVVTCLCQQHISPKCAGICAIVWAVSAPLNSQAAISQPSLSVIKTNFWLLNFVILIKRQTIPLFLIINRARCDLLLTIAIKKITPYRFIIIKLSCTLLFKYLLRRLSEGPNADANSYLFCQIGDFKYS